MYNVVRKLLVLSEIGSVNQLLAKFDPKLGTNEGIGRYSYLTVESDISKPYTEAQEIRIPLTNSNVDIVEFHRNFFTLNLDLYLNFHCDITELLHAAEAGDSGSLGFTFTRQFDKFFIGFKSATDCIDSYRMQHNGVDIGSTMQNRGAIESFLYNQMKGESEKKSKHSSYSLHEEVLCTDESICGVYLTYAQLAEQLSATNNRVHVQFPVTIGFDMLLPLQGLNLFPTGIFGDLALIIKVIPNALVWACTDPKLYISKLSSTTVTTASQNTMLNCRLAYNNIVPATAFSYYDHRFTQTRVQGLARSNLTVNLQDGNYMSLFYSAPLRIDPDS
jgi:hypothetical protein